MRNVYTVKQVNEYIKNMFTQDFMLNKIYVRGEVSNCKYHSSGHIYFSLKDESGTISCVMFASDRSGLGFPLEDGQNVTAFGNINVYEREGSYELYVREITLDGAGVLYEKYEALKKTLEEMGMFAEEYKQPIPKYAQTVGIVTASTGAAIRDIIHVAKRRNPYVQLILYPALVQGEGAVESIVTGIQTLDRAKVDVIIVGRGGGSIEDLWAFNEEAVARAIFECQTPVISAVGHETDTLISDYVADLRAPTPSAAAEMAVYEYSQVRDQMMEYEQSLRQMLSRQIEKERKRAQQLSLRLKYTHPRQKWNEKQQLAVELENRLRADLQKKLEQDQQKIALFAERLKGVSPLNKLACGYAYVRDAKHQAVRSVDQVKAGDTLWISVMDGTIEARVTDRKKEDHHGG